MTVSLLTAIITSTACLGIGYAYGRLGWTRIKAELNELEDKARRFADKVEDGAEDVSDKVKEEFRDLRAKIIELKNRF